MSAALFSPIVIRDGEGGFLSRLSGAGGRVASPSIP